MFDSGIIPPLGAVSFRIARINGTDVGDRGPSISGIGQNSFHGRLQDDSRYIDISNGLLTARFDRSTGQLNKMSQNGVDLDVTQSWGYYTSFDSSFDSSDVPPVTGPQNSGAYIFRPSHPEQELTPIYPAQGGAVFVNTTVGTEVHVSFQEPWLKQVTRVLKTQPYVEVEYVVGPIPIDDGRGKEIVARFSTPIQSKGVFFTDSNGREFIERRRNFRPSWSLTTYEPVAGNFHPVNAAIYMEDSTAALSVAVDRSQGGASLHDGSIELMVQRRTLVDDGRGVGEPMNETTGGMSPYPPYGNATRKGHGVIVRGVHRIMVGKGPIGASLARSIMDGVFAEPLIFVGSAPSSNATIPFRQAWFSAIQSGLPPSVMLITFARLPNRKDSTFLVRLGHQYAAKEHPRLSAPVQLDLLNLFAEQKVVSVVEKTLSGNQDRLLYEKKRLSWTQDTASSRTNDVSNTTISIAPMDIRTFEIAVAKPASPRINLNEAIQ